MARVISAANAAPWHFIIYKHCDDFLLFYRICSYLWKCCVKMSMTKSFNASMTTTELPGNGTDPSHDPRHISRSIGFLLIPFSVIAFFCVLSGVVSHNFAKYGVQSCWLTFQLYYLMKKRRLDQLRHHLVPLYTFDPGEGDDWEAEVLEPSSDPKQQKRLHVRVE